LDVVDQQRWALFAKVLSYDASQVGKDPRLRWESHALKLEQLQPLCHNIPCTIYIYGYMFYSYQQINPFAMKSYTSL